MEKILLGHRYIRGVLFAEESQQTEEMCYVMPRLEGECTKCTKRTKYSIGFIYYSWVILSVKPVSVMHSNHVISLYHYNRIRHQNAIHLKYNYKCARTGIMLYNSTHNMLSSFLIMT